MAVAELIPVEPLREDSADRVNFFIHGYRSLTSTDQIKQAKRQVIASGAGGENYLVSWAAGRWRDSATVAGLRAAYRVARFRTLLAPWMVLVDAGVIGLAEAAQFKYMERQAEQVGRQLAPLLAEVARDGPINLIGHSLGARVIHTLLAEGDLSELAIEDCVLLAGAADATADNWPECVARIQGVLHNAYSPKDRVLRITPDLRRRVGYGPLKIEAGDKVINHRLEGVSHVDYWSRLGRLLPLIWDKCASNPPT